MRQADFKKQVNKIDAVAMEHNAELEAVNYRLPQDREQFNLLSAFYGLKRSDFNKEFKLRNNYYTIIGIKENSQLSPIVLRSRCNSIVCYPYQTIQKVAGDKEVIDACTGIELAKQRNSLLETLEMLQEKQKAIAEGRVKAKAAVPVIGADEYINRKWSIDENDAVIRSFRMRTSAIVSKWSIAENKVGKMAQRRIVNYLMIAYQIQKQKAIYLVEDTFIHENFIENFKEAEKAIAKKATKTQR